ncbi:pre-mRNA-processing factor 39 isoform X1 [Danio aesculapii]|uniref:pre-mRNA-processing factor 39 isoform X1 n=1 Tax=Danio aesculapii TaxID=1142201 RepID=UPI0024C0A00C|nr:pre-mRNA-processing factor 39 isoform X1 [Danio aesculapii]
MAAEGAEDLSNDGDLANRPEHNEPEDADLPKPDDEEETGGADGGDPDPVVPTASITTGGEEEEGEMPADFERLWKITSDNPQDFNSWTDLLQYCEQEGHMRASRQALNAFLLRYPLCYGYWKKFADLERRAGHNEKAEEVCERGLKSIPLSVDLWIHYINLLLGTLNMNLPESTRRIRSVFEEAVSAAGWDFHSDRLWDLYAEWEKEQNNLTFMTRIYDRVLGVPTHHYNTHYEKLKTHLNSWPPQDTVSPKEFSKVRAEYKQSQIQAKKERSSEISPDEEERPPGDEEHVDNGKDSEEAVQKMQELLLVSREQVYQQNEAEVRKRWNFEESIKRPYFHVKPLDRAQLKAWHSYLDWEIAEAETAAGNNNNEAVEGDEGSKQACVAGHNRVIILFERCLVACALYEEFWNRYVHYLAPWGLEEVRNVYRRACQIHLPYKHSIHLQWALFEEKHGNISEAQRILESLELSMPGLAAVRLGRVGLERRTGHLDVAESLLKETVDQSKHQPSLHAFYSIKLARFLHKLCKSPGKARAVLQEAIELSPDNGRLYQNLLELELCGDLRVNGAGVQQCVAKALAAPLSPKTKIRFSQRGLQFAEDFGTTVQSVLSLHEEHQKLLKEHDAKRAAENSDDDPEKMSKMDDVPTMPQIAPPTIPQVPMTTPPPSMMGGDMSGSYGNYSSWYQQQYGAYGSYQNPWSQYSQYYPPS